MDIVAQLVRELEVRRCARAGNVVPLERRLLEADKRGQPHPKSYGGGGAGGGGATTSSSRAKSTTFTTSGNKYDPLNTSF